MGGAGVSIPQLGCCNVMNRHISGVCLTQGPKSEVHASGGKFKTLNPSKVRALGARLEGLLVESPKLQTLSPKP